jgi:DNA transformation protein
VLYFKADDASRGDYETAGMNPFQPFRERPSMSYYELPPEVLEDEDQLRIWTRKTMAAARRKPKASRKGSSKR